MSIDTLIGVPSAAQRIGSGSWRTPAASNRWQLRTAASSGASPTIPQLTTRNWLMLFRYRSTVNSNSTQPLWLGISGSGNNRLVVEHRAVNNEMRAQWSVGSTNNTATIGWPAALLGQNRNRVDGTNYLAVWRNGSTLNIGFVRASERNTLHKSSATITHTGDMSGYVTGGGTMRVGATSDTGFAIEALYGPMVIARCAASQAMDLTDQEIIDCLLDLQRIDDHAAKFDEIWAPGDFLDASDNPIGNNAPVNIDASWKWRCPRTGLTLTPHSEQATPSVFATVFPAYSNLAFRSDEWLNNSPTNTLLYDAGPSLIGICWDRSDSTNNTHGKIEVWDKATLQRCKWPIPIALGTRYIDSGDSHSAKETESTWGAGTRWSDFHQTFTAAPLGDAIVHLCTYHSEVTSNDPNTGNNRLAQMPIRLLDDDNLMPPIIWLSENGDGPALPEGTAYTSDGSGWRQYNASYHQVCRVGEWIVGGYRTQDTGSGYEAAFAVRGDGVTRYRQIEVSASSSAFTAGIPVGAVAVGGDRFLLVWNPRFNPGTGNRGYPTICGIVGRITGNGDDFVAPSSWIAPTGEVCDGTGATPLELATSSVRTDQDAISLWPENSGVAVNDRDGVFVANVIGRAIDGRFGILVSFDAAGPNAEDRGITDAVFRVYRWTGSEIVVESTTSLLDLYPAPDPDPTDPATIETRGAVEQTVFQWTDPEHRGAVALIRERDGTVTPGTDAPTDFQQRFGTRIRAIYFPDLFADPTNRVDLGILWDRTGSDWLSIATGRVNFADEWSTIVCAQAVTGSADAIDARVRVLAMDIDDLIEPHRQPDDEGGLAQHITVIVDPRRMRDDLRRLRERRRRFGA